MLDKKFFPLYTCNMSKFRGETLKENRKVKVYKRQKAFTLVELMVVVAIIAILGTMSVGNFSSAIKRTRNSVRVSDMQAVAKAMEVCYDAMSGHYTGISIGANSVTSTKDDSVTQQSEVTGTLFAKDTNTCLNNDIVPAMSGFPYTDSRIVTTGSNDKFVVCAKLEPVGGAETVANSDKKANEVNTTTGLTKTACKADDDYASCYYCIMNQQ